MIHNCCYRFTELDDLQWLREVTIPPWVRVGATTSMSHTSSLLEDTCAQQWGVFHT